METTAPAVPRLHGPVALRALARAFAHLGDFDRFVSALESALTTSTRFKRTVIRLDPGMAALADPAEDSFPGGTLSMPIAGDESVSGVLQVRPADGDHKHFDAEDLHLLAGLADFLAAVLDQAVKMKDANRSRELLRFLLNQAPVGLAAYTPEKRLLVANDLATQWLGDAGPPFLEIEAGSGGFHLRAGGKLIYGEARRAPDGVWVVALHDLTPGQVRLMETLQRETFRGLVEQRPVSFVLLESARLADGVLKRLPTLRQGLGADEQVGPYDATRIGLVLSGAGGLASRHRLRRLRDVLGDSSSLRAGVAELGRDGTSPDALLESALRRTTPYGDAVRPSVLVHGDNEGVVDAVRLVLGRDYRVVHNTELARTRECLRREEFDVLITDLELRGEVDGVALAREALATQPSVKPLFLSVHLPPHPEVPPELAAGGAGVVPKPFTPDELKLAVRDRLAT